MQQMHSNQLKIHMMSGKPVCLFYQRPNFNFICIFKEI